MLRIIHQTFFDDIDDFIENKKNKYALITDREEMLKAVRNEGYALEYADDNFKSAREVVLEAVKNAEFGGALEHASEELQNDPELKKLAEG